MIGFLVFGLVVGVLARLIKPGRQNLGILATLGLALGFAFLRLIALFCGCFAVGWIFSGFGATNSWLMSSIRSRRSFAPIDTSGSPAPGCPSSAASFSSH